MSPVIIILIIFLFLLIVAGIIVGLYFALRKSSNPNPNPNPNVPTGQFLIMSGNNVIIPDLNSFQDQTFARWQPIDNTISCVIYSFSFNNGKLMNLGGAQPNRLILGYLKSGSNALQYIDTILNPNYATTFETDFIYSNSKWCSKDGTLCMQMSPPSSEQIITMVSSANATTLWTNVPPSPTLCRSST